jgi:hypothetical protein
MLHFHSGVELLLHCMAHIRVLAGHLQFLEMEGRVDDPPVLGPFLTLVASQSIVQPPLEDAELELLEVAKFVRENFSYQPGLGDGHPGHRPKPGDGRFTCHGRSIFSHASEWVVRCTTRYFIYFYTIYIRNDTNRKEVL